MNTHIPWKPWLIITVDSLLTFYLATFCLAMFFTHRGTDWKILGGLMGVLYAFVIFACAARILRSLPLPALMIIIPLVPLLAIFVVISLIPVLQLF